MRLFAALAITSMVGIVAPADEGSSYHYVDLGPKGNQALAQDIGAEGNHLKELPQGRTHSGGRSSRSARRWSTSRGRASPSCPRRSRRSRSTPSSTSFTSSSPPSSAKGPATSRTAPRLAPTSSITPTRPRRRSPSSTLVGLEGPERAEEGQGRLAGQEQLFGRERPRDPTVFRGLDQPPP